MIAASPHKGRRHLDDTFLQRYSFLRRHLGSDSTPMLSSPLNSAGVGPDVGVSDTAGARPDVGVSDTAGL